MKIFTPKNLLLNITLIFTMLLSLLPASVFASNVFTGYGIIVEAEDYITDSTQFASKADSSASGGYSAEALYTSASSAPDAPGIEYNFTTYSSMVVNIWLRTKATNGADDSIYASLDNESFKAIFLSASSEGNYNWIKYKAEINLASGNHSIRISTREKVAKVDQIVITNVKYFIPVGVCTEITKDVAELESKWTLPPVTPPKGQHPRVYFTSDRKDEIITNLSAPENALAVSKFNKYATDEITTSTDYNINTLAHIESKALYSYLYDDDATRQQAIAAIDLIAQMKPNMADNLGWRRYGEMIQVLAEIYDWCYDDLTAQQKEKLIILCAEFGANTEIGWPPSKQMAVNGHGSEFQFLRDLMAFAIACYDERPDIWNYIGGRFYEEFVPVRQLRLQGHYNLQGTNYGYYRTEADAYAYALITGMGAPEPYSGENLAGTGYSELYLKRPDGRFLNDGDMYESNILPATYRTNEKDGMLIKSAATSDGILKGEYFRRSLNSSNGRISQTFADNSPVMQLILSNPSVETESFHTLPKSRYFGTPAGIMAARTSWEEGRNSNTVLAMMKIGEYFYSNHQHQDSGTFQIYYKGLLAGKGGKYDLYGTDEHNMYTSKTISHNGLLIYDPSEDDGTTNRQNVNDGGQTFANLTTNEPLKHGQVLRQEIDPGNSIDPEYTYIKGDITDAYTDKVSDVERSMMFINLGIEDMPAAFITFDKITSADKTFKKTWVLHGTQQPHIDGNRAVFTAKPSNEGDEVGVMTVDTLLPKSGNMQSAVYGSLENGFGIVNSWQYDSSEEKWNISKSVNYMPGTDEKDEVNTRRLEISPKTPSLEDKFLNVMFIGDNESEEKAVLVENTTHYGATLLGKAVFFGKTTQDNTTFSISSNKTFDYIICDMAKGTYKITDVGGEQTVCASEDGGVLKFTASGSVSVTKVSNDYTAPTDNAVVPADRIYTKNGTDFSISVPGGENTNAKEFISLYGYHLVKKNNSYTIYNEETVIAEFNLNDKTAVTSKGVFTFTNAPREENGVLIMHFDDLHKLLFDKPVYCDYAKIMFEPTPTGIKGSTVPTTEPCVVTSGNVSVSNFEEINGSYVMKSVLAGNYTHAGNTVYRYGAGTAGERVELGIDSSTGKFAKNKIYRYSSTVTVNVKPTGLSFGSFYYKNGSSLVYPKSVAAASFIPEAGEAITVDSIVDLNTLTSYYYVNNVFAGSHNLYNDLYSTQTLNDVSTLNFGNTLVYIGSSNTQTPGVELFTVTDVKKTEYPVGTTLEDIQLELNNKYYEQEAIPASIMGWRYTVTPKSGSDGVYNVTSKHDSACNGSVVLPIDTVIDSSNSGWIRGTFTLTPKVNMYYTANKLSVVRYEDSTKIGNDQFSVPTPVTIPSLGTTPVKVDTVVNKATGEAKFYINGKYVGSNTYRTSDDSKTLTAKYFGLYIGTTVVPKETIVAEISNAKIFNYPDSDFTYADIEAAIMGNTGIYTEVITPKQRGNVTTVGDMDGTHFVSKKTSGVSEAANIMTQLSEPVVFGATTDKYVVISNKIKFIKHTNDFSYANSIFPSSGNRITADAFALQQGDEYTAKAIIDVAAKKVFFYMDNIFVSEKDIETADVSYLATFMNNYDDEKDGMTAGEVEFSVTDSHAVHYTSDYTGDLDDVIAHEIGSDIKVCSIRTAWYSEYSANDNKSEEVVKNNYRLALIANNFNADSFKCIVAGYKYDEQGNEVLAFTKKIINANYIYDAIPKDFDVLKVFLWDSASNPLMRVYYPTLCRR